MQIDNLWVIKVKIKVTLIANKSMLETKTTAVFTKKEIIYYEKDNTKAIYNYQKDILIRDNNELYLEINFRNNEMIVFVKEINKKLKLPIKTEYIKKATNKLEIKYINDNNINIYKIEGVKK